jgi:hypothetical protein
MRSSLTDERISPLWSPPPTPGDRRQTAPAVERLAGAVWSCVGGWRYWPVPDPAGGAEVVHAAISSAAVTV